MLKLEVLVGKLLSVNGLATGAIALGEVSALNHEVLNHTVESRSLKAEALLSSGQSTTRRSVQLRRIAQVAVLPEILSSLGDGLAIEADNNPSQFFITVLDIEINLDAGQHKPTIVLSHECVRKTYLMSDLRTLCCFSGLAKVDQGYRENNEESEDYSL